MLKRTLIFATVVGMAMACTMDPAQDFIPTDGSVERMKDGFNLTPLNGGNGENAKLSGSHYSLNIIGVPKGKTASMDGNSGHRIFVNLTGNSKIFLSEGDTYQVLDANGTDSNGASFQLPNPDPDNDGVTEYSVWARPLGQPGGSALMTTCATYYGEEVCSTENELFVRGKGKSSFVNVSKDLLYIYADLDEDGTVERYPLFDDTLEGYYWNYDNNGLRILQLRFYEVSTNVN